MRYLPISGFPVIEPEEADPETRQQFTQMQQEVGLPYVPSWAKTMIISPAIYNIYLEMLQAVNRHLTLPQTLMPMILYCIATTRNCRYCSASNELYCRTLGVDEETLEMLAKDLGNVNPQRLRAIIQFAIQCALDPQALTAADYERVRDQGLSDDEMAQIIFLSAMANFNDTLADSFKIEIESVVLEALGR
jgi:alkylhydroperoxidase family enzyme